MSKHLTVLIVDDDDDDKEMFCETVKDISQSYNCLSASNGQEALQLLQNSYPLPDFIFLDLNLPRINGKQCLAQLKKIERLSTIPVIIYTTTRSEEEREKTRELGAVYFLTKPSSLEKLKKEIEFVLDKKYEEVRSA